MILSAGDLGIEIDFGPDQPGAILQHKERDGYHDYLVDGKPVVNPFDVEILVPGFYRLVEWSLRKVKSSLILPGPSIAR